MTIGIVHYGEADRETTYCGIYLEDTHIRVHLGEYGLRVIRGQEEEPSPRACKCCLKVLKKVQP